MVGNGIFFADSHEQNALSSYKEDDLSSNPIDSVSKSKSKSFNKIQKQITWKFLVTTYM